MTGSTAFNSHPTPTRPESGRRSTWWTPIRSARRSARRWPAATLKSLSGLAGRPDATNLPLSSAVMLGEALHHTGDYAKSVRVLRAARTVIHRTSGSCAA